VIIGFLTAVIVFAPAETRIEYARLSCVVYLSGMLWLSFRYSLKTLYYLILLPSERKLKLDDIPKRRVLFRGMLLQKTEAEPVSMPQASRPEPIDVRIVPANSPLRLTSLGNTVDSRPGVRTLPVLDISKAEQEEQIYKSRGLFSCAFEIVGIEEPSIVPENALESMPYSVFESAPAESESAPQKTEIKKEETQKPSPLLRLSYTAERISGI
ncbi:MAG: hypothetical protein FWE66_03475, partial [Oscillospiraceae bacterium]|nr:hypothetical protein [Oscillospiraceae bacterium]